MQKRVPFLSGPPRRYRVAGLVAVMLSFSFLILPMLAITPITLYAADATIYVTPTGTGNGSSWANAADLQDALTPGGNVTAEATDEIWVAAGTYTPGDARDDTFRLINRVAIYGGFAGNETRRDQRDWQTNVTTLSGDLAGDDLDTNGDGRPDINMNENSYQVVTSSNTNIGTVLDGFTITAGNADGDRNPFNDGGGIQNDNGSPRLSNLIIRGNYARISGGGMHNTSGGNPTLTNVSFISNLSDNSGGGMLNALSDATLTNVSFIGNESIGGGGMFNANGSNATLTNVLFAGNLAGGVAVGIGGGMFTIDSNATLTNVTIAGNRATDESGGLFIDDRSNVTIQNSIIWGNAAPVNPHVGGTANYENTLVEELNVGGFTGTENPAFVNQIDATNAPTTEGDYRLTAGSPVINLGNNAFNDEPTDLAGNPRQIDTIDLGAYEYVPFACPVGSIIYVDQRATGNENGSSWADAYTDLQDALLVASGTICPDVEEIWVAAGTYTPGDERGDSFELALLNDVAVYGGFAGTETRREERDWQTHVTTLSGDLAGDDLDTNGDGLPDTNIDDNSYSIVDGSNTSSTVLLDGFTITGGNNDDAATGTGGGMYIFNGNLWLANLIFIGNQARFGGGGVDTTNSSPTLTNVHFISNAGSNGGGGMSNFVSSPTLINVSFIGNKGGFGGGMSNGIGNPTLTNVLFAGNLGTNGGAMANIGSSPTLTNVTIAGNRATIIGGGMENALDSNPTIQNSIIWGNAAPNDPQVANSESTPTYDRTLVAGLNVGGFTGTENPAFVNLVAAADDPTTEGDYRLTAGSPVIDQGNDAFNTEPTDLAGNPRTIGTIDLGAYEAGPELALTKTVSEDTPAPGDTIQYTLLVSNVGTLAANGVILSDTLPSGLSFVAGSLAIDGVPQADPELPILVSDATLPSNTALSITFEAEVGNLSHGTVLTNTASVSSDEVRSPSSASVPITIASPSNPPTVVTNPATNVFSATAILNGAVNPNGQETTVSFRWGETPGGPYPNEVSITETITGNNVSIISADLSGLTPETTYSYVAVGSNANGETVGNEEQFTTLAADVIVLLPVRPTVASALATTDPTPMISGTADSDLTIRLTIDLGRGQNVAFETIADTNGRWSIDTETARPASGSFPDTGLAVGEHPVRVVAIDVPNNVQSMPLDVMLTIIDMSDGQSTVYLPLVVR